jgi:phosphoribosylformimino-5-aminoimidazole carboxamide ribotide isomerase
MQIYPAIDIQRGKAAYLDPVAVAERYLADGATWLHVVDMDRAYGTGGDNTQQIRSITRLPGVSVQLGGLLRTPEQVRHGVDTGATRVVLATAALVEPELLSSLIEAAGTTTLAVAVEVRGGRPVLRGSGRVVREPVTELAGRARDAGIRTIVYRDTERDGTLGGLDTVGAARLLSSGAEIIVAGGGASLDDLRAARRLRLNGVIIGRALHEGRFTLREAIECSRS